MTCENAFHDRIPNGNFFYFFLSRLFNTGNANESQILKGIFFFERVIDLNIFSYNFWKMSISL